VQRAYGLPEQAVLTLPLLVGTDGHEKMSKSLNNFVGLTEPPEEQYGKTLSLPDEAMGTWYRLLLGHDPDPQLGPRDAKRALARAIVERYHGPDAAVAAEAAFDRVFVQRGVPEQMDTARVAAADGVVHLPQVLADAFGMSRSEARRLIQSGGVRLDDEVAGELDVAAERADGAVLRAGKRRFARLEVA
jgi:tyrosyl-tRNA synthetase